jgi:hypothetical protein
MENRTDFVKIRVHILIDPNEYFMFEEGKLKWNPDRLEDFYDADAKFRDPIIGFINDEVGLHNWAIRFQQFYTGQFEVYVYCENEDSFHKIKSIINERLSEHTFRFISKSGTIDDYLNNR